MRSDGMHAETEEENQRSQERTVQGAGQMAQRLRALALNRTGIELSWELSWELNWLLGIELRTVQFPATTRWLRVIS